MVFNFDAIMGFILSKKKKEGEVFLYFFSLFIKNKPKETNNQKKNTTKLQTSFNIFPRQRQNEETIYQSS